MNRPVIPLVLAAIILLSDIGMGFGHNIDAESHDSPVAILEATVGGGGTSILFADPMEAAVAQHYAANGLNGYYGGAGEYWRDDPWRWGAQTIGDGRPGWHHDAHLEAWRFGTQAGYPTDAMDAAITPIVDMTHMEPLLGRDVQVAINTGVGGVFQTPINTFGDDTFDLAAALTGLQFLRDVDVQVTGTISLRDLLQGTNQDQYQGVFPGGERTEGETLEDALAVMVLRHAYQFQTDGGAPLDGARVEVSIEGMPLLGDLPGQWSEWIGLTPVRDGHVRVGNDTFTVGTPNTEAGQDNFIQIRMPGSRVEGYTGDADPGVNETSPFHDDPLAQYNTSLDPRRQDPFSAAFSLEGHAFAPSGGGSYSVEAVHPWEYRGEVPASSRAGSPWNGFAGDSEGAVESVFDLSAFAGYKLRFRFVAATATPLVDQPTIPLGGWAIDNIEVHARGDPAPQPIGILPGDGASAHPDDKTPLAAVIHNYGRTSVNATVTVQGPLQGFAKQITVPSGALGRTFVHAPDSLQTYAGTDGPQAFNVAVAVDGPAATEPQTLDANVVMGPGGEFEIGTVDLQGLFNGTPLPGRLLERGQNALITAEITNLATTPTTYSLGTGAAFRPQVVDVEGNTVGVVTPLAPDVKVPVSRSVVGSVGAADATRTASWIWSGSPVAQEVRVRMVDAAGNEIADGGAVLVEAGQADALRIQFDNSWAIGECARLRESDGRIGVVRCQANGKVTSPALALDPITVRRGDHPDQADDLLLVAQHNGPLTVHVESVATGNIASRPGESAWQRISTTEIPSNGWSRTETSLPSPVPRGWVRLVIETPNGGAIDEVRLDLEERPRLWGRFDVDVARPPVQVASAADTGLAWLHGVDTDAPRPLDGLTPPQPVVLDVDYSVSLEDGDVRVFVPSYERTNLIFFPGDLSVQLPAGRLLQDSTLTTPFFTVNGTDPRITGRHWLDTGTHGFAAVDVARVPPVTEDLGVDGLTGVNSYDGYMPEWETVARFVASATDANTLPLAVPLDDYVNETIQVRFRFHQDLAALEGTKVGVDAGRIGAGWGLEGLQVKATTSSGPQVILEAAEAFAGWDISAGDTVSRIPTDQRQHWPIMEPEPRVNGMERVQCTSEPPLRHNKRDVGSFIVTDPIDLRFAVHPVLDIVHSGGFRWWGEPSQPGINDDTRPVVDIEYQVLGDDGEWPRHWTRANPQDPATLKPVAVDPATGRLALVDPYTGDRVGVPFNTTVAPHLITSTSGFSWDYTLSETKQSFDLAPLRGDQIRFRVGAWSQEPEGANSQTCLNLLDWTIHSLAVHEKQHIIDAAVDQIRLEPDDLPLILAADPTSDVSLPVFPPDRAQVAVDVSNEGLLPIDVAVELAVGTDDLTARAPDVGFIDESSGSAVVTPSTVGRIELQPGETKAVRFLVDATRSAAGEYSFTVVTDVLGAVDANPTNDALSQNMLLAAIRALDVNAAASSVTPFAASTSTDRAVRVAVTNEGNLPEERVLVSGQIMEVIGLDEYAPLDPPVALETRELDLRARGGQQIASWHLQGDAIDLEAGARYAAVLQVAPASDSMRLGAVSPEDVLSLRPSAQYAIEFLVDEVLYATDLSTANTTSLLPALLPVDGGTRAWETTARRSGQDEPSAWTPVPVTGLDIEGPSTGNAWFLPEHEGLEDMEQILVSPEIPAHVIAGTSRPVLSLKYASSLGPDQAVLETRLKEGSTWGPWTPIDDVRSNRIAVILAPDFPYVNRSMAEGEGHGIPPFYESAGGDNWLSAGCTDRRQIGARCLYTPFPNLGPDHVWLDAFNATLDRLVLEVGADNVGIFTTGAGQNTIFQNSSYQFQSTIGELSLAVEGLDNLGKRLETYGGLMLFGDNTTTTLADRSAVLAQTRHDVPDALQSAYPVRARDHVIDREKDEIGRLHWARLEKILQAAPQAGIRVIAAAGPASGAVAASGVAAGASMTTWQEDIVPAARLHLAAERDLRCLGPETISNVSIRAQPKGACMTPSDPPQPDPTNVRNYWYISHGVAQSWALQDLFELGDVELVHTIQDGTNLTPAALVIDDAPSGPTLVTTSGTNVGPWLDAVLDEMQRSTGALPPGDGEWQHLPLRLSTPFGGAFFRDADANEVFSGSPVQFRIRVTSDPTTAGHGWFALDRVEVLGTPNQDDIGVRFIDPPSDHVRAFAPGARFDVALEVTNRGLAPQPARMVELDVDQVLDCQGKCRLSPAEPSQTLAVPALGPGEQILLRVSQVGEPVFGGAFPQSNGLPKREHNSTFAFKASLQDVVDDQVANNIANAVARGQEITRFEFGDVTVTPLLQDAPGQAIHVNAELKNVGTQANRVVLTATLTHARPEICQGPEPAPFACIDDEPVETLWTEQSRLTLSRDASTITSMVIPAGLPGGVYRLHMEQLAFDSDNALVEDLPSLTYTIHVVDDDIEPDGARAWRGDFIDNETLRTSASQVIAVDQFGSDSSTRHPETGQSLEHGWRASSFRGAPGAEGSPRSIEWLRSAAPSYSMSDRTWSKLEGESAAAAGNADFGPDHLLWQPEVSNVTEHPLTLAGLGRPTLTFETQYQMTQGTGYVVSMELAQRQCFDDTILDRINCIWRYPDTGPGFGGRGDHYEWFPLAAKEFSIDEQIVHDLGRAEATSRDHEGLTFCTDSAIGTCRRNWDTNPLAGLPGIWGKTQKSSTGIGGWTTLHYEIDVDEQDHGVGKNLTSGEPIYDGLGDYCLSVAKQEGVNVTWHDPETWCAYSLAHPESEDLVPRPVRFRFSAASFGGDVGVSQWNVDQIRLTSHQLDIQGADKIPVHTLDDSRRVIPIRVSNDGVVNEPVRASWAFTNRLLVPDVDVGVSGSPLGPFRDAVDLDLAPGQQRFIYVEYAVGLGTGFVDVAKVRTPFTVDIQSLASPFERTSVLMDASFEARRWADLEVRSVVLGEDAVSSPATANLGVPLPVTMTIRNQGQASVDSGIEYVILSEKIDPQTGDVISTGVATDASGSPLQGAIDQAIDPYTRSRADVVIADLEWLPTEEGLFRLRAVLNNPDNPLLRIPESNRANNELVRLVAVGPVPLADPRIQELWVEDLDGNVVDDMVAGRFYRFVANVTNRGQSDALGVSVQFTAGAGDPFSIRSMDRLGGSPAWAHFTSSPWQASLRSDGAVQWQITAEVTTQSGSATIEGKRLVFGARVDEYDMGVPSTLPTVTMAPGSRVEVAVPVQNTGTNVAQPDARLTGIDGVRIHVQRGPALVPGEHGNITVEFIAGPELRSGTPKLEVFARQDPARATSIPLTFSFPADKPLGVQVLAPGKVNPLDAAIDMGFSNGRVAPATLTLEPVSGPVTSVPWTAVVQPGSTVLEGVPLIVDTVAPPGTHEVTLRLHADYNGSTTSFQDVHFSLDLDEYASFTAEMDRPQRLVQQGTTATFLIDVTNDGNVALDVSIDAETDSGTIDGPTSVALAPGDTRQVPMRVTATSETATGEVRLTADDTTRILPWRLDQVGGRLEILEVESPDPRPGTPGVYTALVRNDGDAPMEADVALAVDGVLHDRSVVRLGAGSQRSVELSHGPLGAGDHVVMVVARPAGSSLVPSDAGFDDVAASHLDQVTYSDTNFAVPIPVPFAVWALLAAIFVARRSRR